MYVFVSAPENTIVVLPATPYLFPQRPFLLPSIPPAIVVVDHNLQAVNKVVPIVGRNGGDITKTTMVNILPISAYSRPLSATRQKKSNVRLKTDTKKATKKIKIPVKNVKEHIQSIESPKPKTLKDKQSTKESTMSKLANVKNYNDKLTETVSVTITEPRKSSNVIVTPNEKETINKDTPSAKVSSEDVSKPKIVQVLKTTESAITLKSNMEKKNSPKTDTTTNTTKTAEVNQTSKNDDVNTTSNKIGLENEMIPEDKENKLPNILDTTLDNVVDGGNARLELAEEFLAASPTAAFLMSFPLVSGNRADSPAEETQSTALSNTKDISHKRNDTLPQQSSTSDTFFEKTNNSDMKMKASKAVISTTANKHNEHPKYISNVPKSTEPKISSAVIGCNVSNENPFLNLSMPSLISTTCTLSDTTFGLDFESNLNKTTATQPTSNSNIFYKNDPFSTVKNTIYSTSSISSNHDFNGIGLYPCAMEKYASKNKTDFTNIDDNNVMKIGSSRLTYDIDLGWSHKSFDFVTCTSNTTFGKDNMTTVTSSTPFCTSYNPFNPEFHVPLVSTTNKKDMVVNKPNSSFADTLTSFYTQHNLWSEEPFYNTTNVTKSLPPKHQNYPIPTTDNMQGISNVKPNNPKQYEIKDSPETNVDSRIKSTNNAMSHQINEKYTKKSPSKTHINWMTSEIRPIQTAYNPMHSEIKEPHKITYNHLDHTSKRNDNSETNNYFPISMHNFPTQPVQEEFQMWPSARPLGTTEISIEPPPINLPTLVGDLALGPHDKKKSLDPTARTIPQQDVQNCSNFFSVTQLMNRSSDNVPSRYQPTQVESSKPIVTKHNISHYSNDSNRKAMASRIENHAPQPYIFNNPKLTHSYENMAQFSQNKPKVTNKSDKNAKAQKNNYSAEALLRGGSCTQKIQDNSSKFLMPPQKYSDFNTPQDSSVAQVSHFPPIIDYSENSYTGQQFSGTSLYNAPTNTLPNSFYSNFMPGSSNLMPSNYTSGPFTGEFIDYNQSSECNFTNHKYEELKMRNNPPIFQTDRMPTNYKSSRRESAAKHKLECSKKESSKKYQSKRAKLNSDIEEWSEPSHPLWQNKRHPNLMTEELPFSNYVSNQMHSQYQPDFFNSHLMPSNMQAVGPNIDRSLSSLPITSRANFNLSTIFPEITMVSLSIFCRIL